MNRTFLFRLIVFTVALEVAFLNAMQAQTLKWVSKAITPITGGSGRDGAMCFSIGSKIYVGGGYIASATDTKSFYVYDTTTNVWTQKANLPGPATNRSAGVAFAISGKGYIGLGEDNYLGLSGVTRLADLWEYDAVADTWIARAPLPDTARVNSGCFVANNKAYIVGGEVTDMGAATADVWEYDPVANAWAPKTAYPGGVITMPYAFGIGTKGYISCGSVNSAASKKTYQFDAVANSWTPKADFPGAAIKGGVAFAVNNKGYCGIGTPDYSNYSDSFRIYNPAVDTWSLAKHQYPNGPRAFGIATSIGNKGYVGGGWKINTSTGAETFYQDFYAVTDSNASIVVPSEVGNVMSNGNIDVYPNPTARLINIRLPLDSPPVDGQVSVYNMMGQLILTTNWNGRNAIDVSSLTTGQYILELNSETCVFHSRLFVTSR